MHGQKKHQIIKPLFPKWTIQVIEGRVLASPVLKELIFLSVRISLPRFHYFPSNDRFMSALAGSLLEKCQKAFQIFAFIYVKRDVISLRHFSFYSTTAIIQNLKI